MFHTIVFFGASSSQAVHPERMSIDDLAAAAVARILVAARDLVLTSSRAGGHIAPSRNAFAKAKEKLDKHEVTPALASINAAILMVAQPGSKLAENVRDGFDFLVAACAAEAAGVDVRHAQDIYEAAAGEMGETVNAFALSWTSLGAAVHHADGAVRARLGNLLKALHAPQKALGLVKEA